MTTRPENLSLTLARQASGSFLPLTRKDQCAMRHTPHPAMSSMSPARRATRPSATIADAQASYLLHHESTGSQPKTLEWHRRCLAAFQTFCASHDVLLLDQVSTEDAQRWLVELQKVPTVRGRRSARTVNWYARSLRAFARWCCHRGFLAEDFTAWLEMPKLDKPLIRILEDDEFARMVAACQIDSVNRSSGPHHQARNEAILWLLYDTGIRLAEVCSLKLADVDRARGTIIVYGKGRKERKIAVGKNALQVLGRYLTHWREVFPSADAVPSVFLTEQGGITREGIKMLFKRLRVRAGFSERRVHPHLFRHTFAVRYLLAGGDVFSLQELLGHEDMETIRNYTNPSKS